MQYGQLEIELIGDGEYVTMILQPRSANEQAFAVSATAFADLVQSFTEFAEEGEGSRFLAFDLEKAQELPYDDDDGEVD